MRSSQNRLLLSQSSHNHLESQQHSVEKINAVSDSARDGVYRSRVDSETILLGQKSNFEIYSVSTEVTETEVIFKINANLPLTGVANSRAEDGHTGWGDILLKFESESVEQVSQQEDLYAIKFAENNDSPVTTGVYKNVRAVSKVEENSGIATVSAYKQQVRNAGGQPSAGDLKVTEFQGLLTNIQSGEKVSDLNHVTDSKNVNSDGKYEITVGVPRTALPAEDFTAYVIAECANDFVGLEGEGASGGTVSGASFGSVPSSSTTLRTVSTQSSSNSQSAPGVLSTQSSPAQSQPALGKLMVAPPIGEEPEGSSLNRSDLAPSTPSNNSEFSVAETSSSEGLASQLSSTAEAAPLAQKRTLVAQVKEPPKTISAADTPEPEQVSEPGAVLGLLAVAACSMLSNDEE